MQGLTDDPPVINPIFSRRHNLLSKLLLSIISLTFFMMALELILRLSPILEDELVPDVTPNSVRQYSRFMGGTRRFLEPYNFYQRRFFQKYDDRGYYARDNGVINFYTNQYGARWIRSDRQEIEGESVIVLGDSFTYGFGLRYEDTYIFRLQAKIRENDRKATFLNFAFPALNAQGCLGAYHRIKEKVPHQKVFYGLHINDLVKFPTNYVIRKPLLRSNLARKSKLVMFILSRKDQYFDRKARIAQLNDPSLFEKPFFRDNLAAIVQLDEETKKQNAELYVILLPILNDLRRGSFKPLYSNIEKSLEGSGIHVLDLTDSLDSFKDREMWVLSVDQHPNEVANEIFAERLKELVMPLL